MLCCDKYAVRSLALIKVLVCFHLGGSLFLGFSVCSLFPSSSACVLSSFHHGLPPTAPCTSSHLLIHHVSVFGFVSNISNPGHDHLKPFTLPSICTNSPHILHPPPHPPTEHPPTHTHLRLHHFPPLQS